MPNHFSGHVKFTAKAGTDGAKFLKDKFPEDTTTEVPGDEFFAYIGDPCSSEVMGEDGDWYESNIQKWGSKWGAYDAIYTKAVSVLSGDITININYNSAWCAPDRGFYRFAVKHGLEFEGYGEEPGCSFMTHYNNEGTLTFDMPDRKHLEINYGVFQDQDDGWCLDEADTDDEDSGWINMTEEFTDWYVGQVATNVQPGISGDRGADREGWFDVFATNACGHNWRKNKGPEMERVISDWNAIISK